MKEMKKMMTGITKWTRNFKHWRNSDAGRDTLTVPNLLTAARLLSVPLISHAIVTGSHKQAFVLFSVAAFTDVVDGWIARRFGCVCGGKAERER